MNATATRNTATEAQTRLVNMLRDEIVTVGGDGPELHAVMESARAAWRRGAFTVQTARSTVRVLKDMKDRAVAALPPVDAPAAPRQETPEGMHGFGGMIFKVQQSPASGRRYAKVLEEDGDGGWTFTYVPGAIRNLSAATALPAEEAAQFGKTYGVCCVCARTLTNEESIAAGIGPICAEKF